MGLPESVDLLAPLVVKATVVVTHHAVQARYPGWAEDVTDEEYRVALDLAYGVVSWAEAVLRGEEW